VGLLGLKLLQMLLKSLDPKNEIQWQNFIGKKIREILIDKGVIKEKQITDG
jgi:hypothetical protein